LGISRGRLIALEADRLKPDEGELVDILDFAVHEHCLIKRERAGMTQPELAKKLSCSVQHIRNMETGRIASTQLKVFWQC
jgi:ribosome-binding protein aMBF1 (putative translation factor)